MYNIAYLSFLTDDSAQWRQNMGTSMTRVIDNLGGGWMGG